MAQRSGRGPQRPRRCGSLLGGGGEVSIGAEVESNALGINKKPRRGGACLRLRFRLALARAPRETESGEPDSEQRERSGFGGGTTTADRAIGAAAQTGDLFVLRKEQRTVAQVRGYKITARAIDGDNV